MSTVATKAGKKQPGGINDGLVLGILIGLFFGAVGASLFFHFRTADPELAAWADGFSQNFGTEMFGAFLTFLLIEVLLAKRRSAEARDRAESERKEALILQLGSPDNSFAIEAARILSQRGWLTDKMLEGADLLGARLEGAHLGGAHLGGADLIRAHLEGAFLWGVHLEGAQLIRAHLEGAWLGEAHLEEAYLQGAHLEGVLLAKARLEGANLFGAHLEGANLWSACLEGANLQRSDFRGSDLRGATLPDGKELPGGGTWETAWLTWLEEHPELEIEYEAHDSAADTESTS